MARVNARQSSIASGRAVLSSHNSRAKISPGTNTRPITPGTDSDKENPQSHESKKSMATSGEPTSSIITSKKRTRPSREADDIPDHGEEDGFMESSPPKRRRSGSMTDSSAEPSPTPSPGEADDLEDVTSAFQTGDTSMDEPGQRQQQQDQARSHTTKSVRFYDPNQDQRVRREIKRKSRALEREFIENRDQYLRDDNQGLKETIARANEIFQDVKQTADATTDSRLLVSVSDVAHRKSAQLALGDSACGIDVDEFVGKCISYMQRGAREASGAAASQRRRRDGDVDDDADDVLDWTYLGAHACFPFNSRPAVPGFLLGPLSAQKRVRAVTQRRARQRDDGTRETRPEELERENIETAHTVTVSEACGKIRRRLTQHCERAEARVQAEIGGAEATTEEIDRVLRKHRITSCGGPSLFDFVVNPHSFGQTVENLFYVSFLIKEGKLGVDMDEDGLPALMATEEGAEEGAGRKEGSKHQAVFGIDYKTWQDLVKAFDIKESLIPHRDEGAQGQTQPGERGWYG